MRKFLAFVSVVAVAGAVSTASAVDRSGKWALGAQEVFTSDGTSGFGSTAGSWSLKYGVTSNVTGQFTVGFDMINKAAGNSTINFGGRLLYDLVENEMSDFYTGLGIGYEMENIGNGDILRVQIPLGFEFSLPSLPEVGFSFEAGVLYEFLKDAGDTSRFSSVGGVLGGALGLGAHYYF